MKHKPKPNSKWIYKSLKPGYFIQVIDLSYGKLDHNNDILYVRFSVLRPDKNIGPYIHSLLLDSWFKNSKLYELN